MSRWMGRLMLAMAGVAVIACPAAAQDVPLIQDGAADRAESGSAFERHEARVYVDGHLVDSDADAYAWGYERVMTDRPGTAVCGSPDDLRRCPPGVGEVHLPASFFVGGGGVGPVMIWGGGSGGYWVVGTTARAGGVASAYASAGSSVRVSGGGGPPRPRGGSGCH